MKRCPQCEFVYEDEQGFCDMDGSKLTFDSRQLPKLQALTNAEAAPAMGFWRARLVPATAGLVLATVLGLVYYVSVQQMARSQPQPVAAAQSRQAPIIRVAEEPAKPIVDTNESTKTALPETVADEKSTEVAAKPTETQKPQTDEVPVTKKPRPANLNTPKPQPVKPASAEAEPKKESKISAVLKKTGRILKKPFKF